MGDSVNAISFDVRLDETLRRSEHDSKEKTVLLPGIEVS